VLRQADPCSSTRLNTSMSCNFVGRDASSKADPSRMAFNSGRPTLFMGPETVKDGRLFLKHPLSIPTDSRLVNFCELQNWRGE
jgi:hypothetical protein